MDKEMIVDLQSYFDGRGKLNNAITAIKCYSRDSKESSVFFGYVDGFKNKRTINIPIDPKDLLPILEKYVNNIDIQIMEVTNPKILDYELSPDGIPSGWEQNIRESIESALKWYNHDLAKGTPGYELWNEITDQSGVWETPNCFIVNDLGDESKDDMLLLQITNPNEVISGLSRMVPVTIKLKFISRLKG